MDKGYIAPEAALKKLRVAKGLGQAVYIYGATGYGKTELVRQYLSRRRYRYISCAEDAAGLTDTAKAAQEAASHSPGKEKEAQPRTVMVVDDMHLLKNAEGRRQCHEDICISHADKCIMASNSRKLVIKLNSFRHIS